MINVLDVAREYRNQWVVFDRCLAVLDHGPDLKALWAKYGTMASRLTFYFAAAGKP